MNGFVTDFVPGTDHAGIATYVISVYIDCGGKNDLEK
jgi:valyl-tRNA synthetase